MIYEIVYIYIYRYIYIYCSEPRETSYLEITVSILGRTCRIAIQATI